MMSKHPVTCFPICRVVNSNLAIALEEAVDEHARVDQTLIELQGRSNVHEPLTVGCINSMRSIFLECERLLADSCYFFGTGVVEVPLLVEVHAT